MGTLEMSMRTLLLTGENQGAPAVSVRTVALSFLPDATVLSEAKVLCHEDK